MYLEQGVTQTFTTTLISLKQSNIETNKQSISLVGFPNFKRFSLSTKYTLLIIESSEPGLLRMEVVVFDFLGKIDYDNVFHNEGDDSSYEVTEFKFKNDMPMLITTTKQNNQEIQSALIWNGKTFK